MIDSLVILFPDWGRFDIVFCFFLVTKCLLVKKKMHYSPLGNSYSLISFGLFYPFKLFCLYNVCIPYSVHLSKLLFIKGWVEPKSKSLEQIISLVVLVRVRDTRLT